MTLGILLPASAPAQDAPWGWWDDGDSIARPLADEGSFLGTRGGAKLAIGSGTRGRPGSRRLDTRASAGRWTADLAGRCDSSCVGIRQRLSWGAPRFQAVAGDLPAWSGDPLLTDAGRVSTRTTPLARLGSGRSPAGADLRIDLQDLLPWPTEARARLASVVGGGSRGTFEGSLGVLRGGLSFPDAPGSTPLAMGGLHLEGAGTEVEASHLGDPGHGAWRLVLRSRGELLRQEWSIRRRESSDSSPGSGEEEEASARMSWKRDGSRVDWEGSARDDSLARRELRTVASVSQDFAGLVWRLRGRWRGGDAPSTSALVPGVRRLRGRFRPWAEVSWSTGSGARPSGGAAWVDRGWRMEASATRRTGGAWDWTSSSTLGGGGSTLEMRLSERDSELAGGGSWTLAW